MKTLVTAATRRGLMAALRAKRLRAIVRTVITQPLPALVNKWTEFLTRIADLTDPDIDESSHFNYLFG
jgi:hypothetical protein